MAKGRKTGGRLKGSGNKLPGQIKELIEGALADLGGQRWLAQAARKHPQAFMGLVARLIPRDIHLNADMRLTLEQLVTQSLKSPALTHDTDGLRPN